MTATLDLGFLTDAIRVTSGAVLTFQDLRLMGNTPMRAENAALYAGRYSLPISSGSVSWPAIVTEAGGGVSPCHSLSLVDCLVAQAQPASETVCCDHAT